MIPFVMAVRSEYWIYTSFSDIPIELEGAIEHVYQLEVCPTTRRYHYQGFIHYSSAVSRTHLLSKLNRYCHLEVVRSVDAARNYCRKLRTRA